MLPQLVGRSCAVCDERIGSEVDGRFCEGCGNPIHNRCTTAAPSPAIGVDLLSVAEAVACPTCGGNPNNPIAVEVRHAILAARVKAELAPLRREASLYHWWRYFSVLGSLVGALLILFGVRLFFATPDPTNPNSAADNQTFAYLEIGSGVFFGLAGLGFALLQSRAVRKFREARDGESNGPPE